MSDTSERIARLTEAVWQARAHLHEARRALAEALVDEGVLDHDTVRVPGPLVSPKPAGQQRSPIDARTLTEMIEQIGKQPAPEGVALGPERRASLGRAALNWPAPPETPRGND